MSCSIGRQQSHGSRRRRSADLSLSTPHFLFEHAYAYGPTITVPNYDVTPDGERFLMVQSEPDAGRLAMVLNWFDELRRLTRQP